MPESEFAVDFLHIYSHKWEVAIEPLFHRISVTDKSDLPAFFLQRLANAERRNDVTCSSSTRDYRFHFFLLHLFFGQVQKQANRERVHQHRCAAIANKRQGDAGCREHRSGDANMDYCVVKNVVNEPNCQKFSV